MTDPFNDHTPDPVPPSNTPLAAADAAPPDVPIPVAGEQAPKGPSFAELGLHADVLRAVDEMGFSEPMPVQSAILPLISAGRDLMVQSRTGSGKTAAFGIPFANGLVNAEREVRAGDRAAADARAGAAGRGRAGARSAQYRQITVVADLRRRADGRAGRAAARGRPDRRAARRGACSTTCGAGRCSLDAVRCAVLDECDEMLSMGFQEDIETILEQTPNDAADAAVLGDGARGHPAPRRGASCATPSS